MGMDEKIREEVEENPGIHFRGLQRALECSSTTLNYHIDDLELEERRIRGYRRFYPIRIPERFLRPLAAMNHSVRGQILCCVEDGETPSCVVESVPVSKSTVSSHLKILEEDGVVKSEERGRTKVFCPTQDTEKALERYSSVIKAR
ncbi:MAG: ArsR family transcriptional regulator [Candidatus Nanohalobium sp.]